MHKISFREDILPLKDKLFRLALRVTLNRAEAEDIVQDALIKVWSKREEWRKWESIEAYCLTVTRNLSIDRLQKKENQTEALSTESDRATNDKNPQEELINNEQMLLIHRLMNQLPDKQRTIMHLRDIEGKNYKEIATILNISEEQVKVNLFRARQKIKQWYLEIDKYGL